MSEPNRLLQFQELLSRALKKFSVLIRGAPLPSDTSAWERDCQESLKVFSDLWKFQQDHRSTLVEAGLTRADIGEIASKIGQLYYNLYLRTSGSSWLLESYTFFEAIHTRAYFSSGGLNQSVKQLKFYARFIIVCLLLNKKEEAWNLVQEFQALVSTFAMKFSPQEAQEWQLVVHSVTSFLNADVAMPVPRSPGTCITYRPNFRCCTSGPEFAIAPHTSCLREVIMASYQQRQVKIAELPIDSFRLMLALEWHDPRLEVEGMDSPDECSDASPPQSAGLCTIAAHSNAITGSQPATRGLLGGAADTQMVALGPASSSAIAAATPVGAGRGSGYENPYRRLLHRTTAPILLSFLASSVLELGKDEVLLLHLVGHGHWSTEPPSPLASQGNSFDRQQQRDSDSWGSGDMQQQLAGVRLTDDRESATASRAGPVAAGVAAVGPADSSSTLLMSEAVGSLSCGDKLQQGEETRGTPKGVLLSSGKAAAGSQHLPVAELVITPQDIVPFTRRRLMLIVDSDASRTFFNLGSCSGCVPALCLLAPPQRPAELLHYSGTGAFFTMALTCPVMAFCLLFGEMDPSAQQLTCLEHALNDAVAQLGEILAVELKQSHWSADSGEVHSLQTVPASQDGSNSQGHVNAWSLAFSDVLLRRLVLRFVLIRAALAMHIATRGSSECQPSCCPALPEAVDAGSEACQSVILSLAALFKKQHLVE